MNQKPPPMPSDKVLLHTEGLTKRFPGVLANDNISFDVRRGEIHCLLGENGAGKTTLAECLYGFYAPDQGEIYFEGRRVSVASPHDAIQLGIGMVHQHFVLVQPLTVLENIVVGTEIPGLMLDLRHARRRVEALCHEYGLELDLGARIWQLSVGEQQWVEILKALYGGVRLLVLDEPTAVLTPQEAEKLFAIMRRMKEEGLSILFITHKLREVMEVSDRVTVLRKGRREETVPTAQVNEADLARMMVGREVVFRVARKGGRMGDPVLAIRGLRVDGDRGQEAVRGIELSLRQGEIVGVAGVSGNGQRELFEALIGVRGIKAGRVMLGHKDITHLSPSEISKLGIAQIPEDRIHDGLIPEFSVAENMILGFHRQPPFCNSLMLNYQAVDRFARQSIEAFGIDCPSPHHITRHLSGGNLQRVILARELSRRPKCLLANQPTRGLDVGAIEYVRKRLLELREEGVAILLISEDLDEVLGLSDRIAVLFKGQTVGLFNAEEAQREEIGLLMAGAGVRL